jgi:hypothetical protein
LTTGDTSVIIRVEGNETPSSDTKEEEPQMQSWREEAHQIVRQTIAREGLTIEEAAARFAVKPRRIKNILKEAR